VLTNFARKLTIEAAGIFLCKRYRHKSRMKYGYARVSTDGQSVAAQVVALRAAGATKVFREVASGAKSDRRQLRKAVTTLGAGDLLMVTRLDRLARSTRDLLNTLAIITDRKAGFRSLGDAWADTTTPHGRLMLTVLGGLAEFERDLIRARTGEGGPPARAVSHRGCYSPLCIIGLDGMHMHREGEVAHAADITAPYGRDACAPGNTPHLAARPARRSSGTLACEARRLGSNIGRSGAAPAP
jgi:hypothetical protein